jgi:signal transduction histidine kinase
MLLQTTFLLLLTFHFSLLTSSAQGLPMIRNYTAAEYGGHNRNYDIEIGEDGTVFVANFEGLLYYDRSQWRIIHAPDINRVTILYRDKKNTIWVGGYNFISCLEKRANGEVFMQKLSKEGQFEGEVLDIFEENGALQFVVSDNNIYEIRNNQVVLKKRTNAKLQMGVDREILSVDAIKAGRENVYLEDITQTEKLDGGLQVKVKKDNGLIITDDHGHQLYTINEANGLCSNQVAYVVYDGHGVLWGCTAHGIFAIELPSVYTYILPKDGLTGEVQTIAAYGGKIYVGGTNGLYVISARQCQRIAKIDNICWKLSECRGELLAATSSGIFRILPNGSVVRMTSDATTALLVDGDQIYAAEPDGVHLYLAGQSSMFYVQSSKLNNLPLVTDIRQDGQDGLWFENVYGQTHGKDPGKVHEPASDLPRQLFMPVSDIEIKAQYRYGDQVWIGGDEILAIVDTSQKELARLTDYHHVRFCAIIMGNDSVLWGGYGDMPKELQELGSSDRHLHFFYALNYEPLTGKTLYRYRLNNDRWSVWSEKKDVEFLKLPYGSFTLSVQAQLANGELSEEATVNFSIAFPLLMRWYIVVLYIITFAYLVHLLFRYRLKKLEKDKMKLERIVEERTADLRNAQDELIRQEKMASVGKLTEGLIDRILNPMNYIINFSKMSIDLLKDVKGNIENNKDVINQDDYDDTEDLLGMLTENLENVDQYGQNTTRTLKAMEEMLKDRTGGYVDMDLLPVLQQEEEVVNNYFAQEKAQYGIQTVFTLPHDSMPLYGNADMLHKTIMNLLNNAVYAVVKAAGRRKQYTPVVSLTATVADGHYSLKIRDNGIGIEEAIIGKIFDPFFTTKTTGEASGIGLYLSREIIQNHQGDISVVSVKDEFTEFTITLPKLKT